MDPRIQSTQPLPQPASNEPLPAPPALGQVFTPQPTALTQPQAGVSASPYAAQQLPAQPQIQPPPPIQGQPGGFSLAPQVMAQSLPQPEAGPPAPSVPAPLSQPLTAPQPSPVLPTLAGPQIVATPGIPPAQTLVTPSPPPPLPLPQPPPGSANPLMPTPAGPMAGSGIPLPAQALSPQPQVGSLPNQPTSPSVLPSQSTLKADKRSSLALAALIVGVVSVLLEVFVSTQMNYIVGVAPISLAAIGLGIPALGSERRGLAIAGVVLGSLSLVSVIILFSVNLVTESRCKVNATSDPQCQVILQTTSPQVSP